MTKMAGAQPKLELAGIRKVYGNRLAVRCDALSVRQGEFLTLLGPSGSGKTTLLMMIAGFTEPTAGRILVDGGDVTQKPAEKRNFGMMFQGYALFPHLTVAQNVGFPLTVRGRPKAEIERRVAQALAQVRLDGFGERLPKQLSGGQQQRVALARATVFDPELLLLDEPLSALDRKLRVEMQAEIKHAHANLGKTFIYVTHDQDEALSLSDRIVILHDGEIMQIGRPSELYERPNCRFVASFLGESNFLAGRIIGRTDERIEYTAHGRTFVHRGVAADGAEAELTLCLRPEKIGLYPDEAAASVPNRAAGVIVSRSYRGDKIGYEVETDGLGTIAVSRAAWGSALHDEVGAKIWLGWSDTATVSVKPGP
jgi:putative spermidine/putrescine transport system ATP-binding protein